MTKLRELGYTPTQGQLLNRLHRPERSERADELMSALGRLLGSR